MTTPARLVADLTAQLLAAEHAHAERTLNRVRAVVLLLLGCAALLYAPSLTPELVLVNSAVLLPLLGWTAAQQVYLHQRGRAPRWLPSANGAADVTAVTALLLGYGWFGDPGLAVKSPIFLAYFAILAARPFTGSVRHAAWIAGLAVAQYLGVVLGFVLGGLLEMHANPLDTVASPGTSPLDEGAKLLLLAVTGAIAVYATDRHERVLRRALATQVERDAEERELAIRLQEADKLAAVGALAATIAHEVTNPLASISLLAETLRRSPLSEQQRDDVHSIADEARRTSHVVRDLLRVVRPQEEWAESVSLARTAEHALAMLRPIVRDRRVSVEAALPPDLPRASGFPQRLEQVVINLLINAVQAMDGQSAERRLIVRAGGDGTHVWLDVEDTGPGLPPGSAHRIFERFFTTKPVGKGTGLGLWIAQQIVAEHGGTLSAGNRPEGGARFRLTLPIESAAAPVDVSGEYALVRLSA